jgi:glycosyltransferase involved in cell wall biosynthesis
MKVALVASSHPPHPGGLPRHVDELARGLARRGTDVEVLVQGGGRGMPRIAEREGVVVRRFPMVVRPGRFATVPGLSERLRRTAAAFDLADVHTARAPLALTVARAGFGRLVFTPDAPIQRVVHWPYAHMTRLVVDAAASIVCRSHVDADLLGTTFPWAADRVRVVPTGVDGEGIRAACPFAHPGRVVLTVGPLERRERVDRAIAAMASLDAEHRLVVVGDGPNRHRLRAYAADLRVSSRVRFVGSVPDADLYRWLRTGHVLVALAEQQSSGVHVTEALTAGALVVASDTPVHREAAADVDGSRVIFVSPEGSPLEVADAISEAAGLDLRPPAQEWHLPVPSWDSVVDRTLELYEGLVSGGRQALAEREDGMPPAPVQIRGGAHPLDAPDLTVHG